MNINTTGWDYLDQSIEDENEDGDLLGYYFDGDKHGYTPILIQNGTYTELSVPGSSGHVFGWTFAGPGAWAGRVRFNSTYNPAHWIREDGTGLQLIAPFGATLASINDAAVIDEVFKGVVGYYRDPSTDDLPSDQRVTRGLIADATGASHSIAVPDSQAPYTSVTSITDRCTIVGSYRDGEGNSCTFIGIPKEPGQH